jgi:hypothetical protein
MAHGIKLLMIDNYDSFTYNIVQYLGELGAEVTVARNDEISTDDIDARLLAGQLGPVGDITWPVLASRGRNFGGGHSAICRPPADSGCVPGAPGDWRSDGWQDCSGATAHAW